MYLMVNLHSETRIGTLWGRGGYNKHVKDKLPDWVKQCKVKQLVHEPSI